MASNGYIKMFRKFIEWGWYSDSNTKTVFLHLLITANFRETEFRGYKIAPGQTVVGRKALSKELGLSEQQIRTALDKLESTGEISRKSTNRFTIITVENWGKYQANEDDSNQQITNKQPTDNQQITNKQPHLKKERSKEGKKDIYSQDVHDIISYLNGKTGYHYRETTSKSQQLIRARMNEHFTVDDFKKVIDNMTAEWLGDKKWQKYLRPETLFGPKFESYLNRIPAKPKDDYDYGEVI